LLRRWEKAAHTRGMPFDHERFIRKR